MSRANYGLGAYLDFQRRMDERVAHERLAHEQAIRQEQEEEEDALLLIFVD
jgi:hypothetical protein